MKNTSIESLRGLDLDLPAILRLFETKAVIENIGAQQIVENIGTQQVIETILSSLNDDEKEGLIDRIRQSQGNGSKE